MKIKLLFLVALALVQVSHSANTYSDNTFTNSTLRVAGPTAPVLATMYECDDNYDGFTVFNLTVQTPYILAVQSGPASNYNVTYHQTLTDATFGSNPANASAYYNIVPVVQTVYYRVTDINTSEYAVGSFTVVVNDKPNWVALANIVICDDDANPQDGTTSVDLTQKTYDILAAQPISASNYTVSYYTNMAAANASSNPIINTNTYMVTNNQTVWYRVRRNLTGCYTIGSFEVIVNPFIHPLFYVPEPICPGSIAIPPPSTSINGITGTWTVYYSTETTGYLFLSDAGQCTISAMMWNVPNHPLPTLISPSPLVFCDTNNNGFGIFDLNSLTVEITGGQNYIITFYENSTDAQIGANALFSPYANISSWAQTIYARGENPLTGCYSIVPVQLVVSASPEFDLISNNTLNTVYVDESNNVVQPLLLSTQLSGNYAYEWYLDGVLIPNANGPTYLVDTASLGGGTRTFSVNVTGIESSCFSIASIIVEQSMGVPSPLGALDQTFTPGQTLANLVVMGSNIQWYAMAANRSTTSAPLPISTPLVDGTTYYASQTIGVTESIARLPVTVHVALGVDNYDILTIRYAPNPVKGNLTLQSSQILKSVVVYTMLGQKVFEQHYDTTDLSVDLSSLKAGNYILKAQGETNQKTIRIVKE